MLTSRPGRLNATILVVAVLALLVEAGVSRSASSWATLLVPVSFLVVGWLVLRRYPRHVEGRLLLGIGLAWGVILGLPFDGGWVVPVGLMGTHLVLRFPDGQLLSPRWRWFSHGCTVLIVLLTVVVTTASKITSQGTVNRYYLPWTQALSVFLLLFPAALVVSVVSVVLRYRRSGPIERAQIRWLGAAAATIVVIYSITLATSFAYDGFHHIDSTDSNWFAVRYPFWLLALQFVALLSFMLIPAAFGVAILRYHLYDIDRIISRTTAYVLVTALLVGTFAVTVTVMSVLLGPSNHLGVALATLAVAGIARPVLTRVRTSVDKRFNRVRYDALRTVDEFGSRLRHEVDPDVVASDLMAVVGTTLEPVRARITLVARA
ncbi:MAG TPA: hypothetical protein VMI11_06835 [Actinomycetes bacterium]|nr:hypothetical protein [Actinomycetes bacterium]